MDDALVIGGTRFIGRHLVEELLERSYDVTIRNRGTHENPFADDDRVDRVEGDRTNEATLEAAATTVDPDAVFDCVAYRPRDVRAATRIFDDCPAYVYVSSGSAYGREEIPKREGETPLESDRDGSDHGPDRDAEERVLGIWTPSERVLRPIERRSRGPGRYDRKNT